MSWDEGVEMPLMKFWTTAREEVLSMRLEAVVRAAGDGQLKDGSVASQEFRQFLSEIDCEKLAEYAISCVENGFQNSGQVLQDVVNEIGRRIGFKAENGRYQGVRNDIGFDGIWAAGGESLVVEVKTTDAYTIKLDVIARYRDRLVEGGRVPRDTPILLVIGRNDTESLEAQVRGSKHAWSMRIIGIDALIKLMQINLSTLSSEVTDKIHKILRPFEYTRIDEIVDVVFTATEDKGGDLEEPNTNDEQVKVGGQYLQDRTPKETIDQKKADAISRLGTKYSRAIQRRRHSMYADALDGIHVVVAVSKRYQRSENYYWYAYHNEPQRRFLSEAAVGLMVFGMTDLDFAFAVPYGLLEDYWGGFYGTIKKNGQEYKHIYIHEIGGKYFLRPKDRGTDIDLTQFII
jgi:hypothetical protein